MPRSSRAVRPFPGGAGPDCHRTSGPGSVMGAESAIRPTLVWDGPGLTLLAPGLVGWE